MGNRYSLRFESGEREGEELSLSAPRFTIGRKPGNTLQILEASVSGAHAELLVDERGVLLRDLGSTNGTRVGSERVLEQRVAGGDVITFGSVPLRLIDAELGAAPSAAAASRGASSSAGAGEGIGEISADIVAKSGRRSLTGLLVALVLVLAGGGAAWYFLLGGGAGEGGAAARPVEPVEGNLLAEGYSFEAEEHGWRSSEEAPADFLRRSSARRSGEYGMQALLEGGERAQLASPELTTGEGRLLTLRAALEGEDDAAVRVGLELSGGESAADGPLYCWSDWIAGGGFEEVALEVAPPPGCRRARALVEGRAGAGGGRVAADDVSLVSRVGTPGSAAKVGEWDLFLLGAPAQSAALYKVSRRLIGDLAVVRAESDDAPEAVELTVTNEGGVLVLRASGAGAGATLSLRAEPEALRLGLATMGESGYRPHGAELRREDASALLLGADRDLVALRFAEPATVVGTAEGEGSRIRVPLGASGEVRIQLDFTAERAEAGTLAMRARTALTNDKRGECLRAWRQLLREYPYEEALVAEAEETRARLVQEGMNELQSVQEELERAQFFRLVDLYDRCRERARAVGARYAASEVEVAAQELVAEVERSLASLETDRGRDEVRRLRAILGVLEAQEATQLAAQVRSYLAQEFGVDGRDG